ncbi:MAG TPA: extracellular solute-binding protein [Chloroflexota bacterium]|nr:extracellular solute-binding protein [Chloroflexota bacterium]
MARWMAALLAGLGLLAACTPPAASPGAGAPASRAATPSDAAAYRQQVIEGARAEGEVNILLSNIWTDEALARVAEAVEREYGVRLKINRTPSTNYPAHAATLLSELAANVTPSFDMHQSGDVSSALLLRADALEPVDWAALLPAGTPPEVIQGDGRLLVTYTAFSGLWYDPAVVAESEVPRSLQELAHPRWRGRVMLAMYPDTYMPYVLKRGREETLTTLRAVMQNGALVGTYFDIQTRLAAREVAMGTVSSIIYHSAQRRGLPGTFTLLDLAIEQLHHVSVPRRVAHPNAAKLIAATLAGPEGQRIAAEYIGASNRYYTGSTEHRLTEQARAAGIPEFSWASEPDVLDFLLSPSGEEVRKELSTILQGG